MMWVISSAEWVAAVLAALVIALGSAIIFDWDRTKARALRTLPLRFPRNFRVVNTRSQIQELYRQIFIDAGGGQAGRIFLMSNTGGLPEYDPFGRILELSEREEIEIHFALSRNAFDEWTRANPSRSELLVARKNVAIYVFNNSIPYKYRIGVNTGLGLGFVGIYYGQDGEKVVVEGISSRDSLFLDAIQAMFRGLIASGKKVR